MIYKLLVYYALLAIGYGTGMSMHTIEKRRYGGKIKNYDFYLVRAEKNNYPLRSANAAPGSDARRFIQLPAVNAT